jgi:hypothetical protein
VHEFTNKEEIMLRNEYKKICAGIHSHFEEIICFGNYLIFQTWEKFQKALTRYYTPASCFIIDDRSLHFKGSIFYFIFCAIIFFYLYNSSIFLLFPWNIGISKINWSPFSPFSNFICNKLFSSFSPLLPLALYL